MTIREIINIIFLFILYLALQILIVRNLVLFDFAFSFIYIACILLIPLEISTTVLLLIAFATGIIVDTFYNTLGIHAAATVLMAYLRPLIIRIQLDPRGQESRLIMSLQGLGSTTFFRYVFVMALIHHAALFYIEASSITLFFPTLLRTVASSLFSTVCIVLIQFFTRN